MPLFPGFDKDHDLLEVDLDLVPFLQDDEVGTLDDGLWYVFQGSQGRRDLVLSHVRPARTTARLWYR